MGENKKKMNKKYRGDYRKNNIKRTDNDTDATLVLGNAPGMHFFHIIIIIYS